MAYAVTGSMAPSTDVMVDPMAFTALINARFDSMVGTMASRLKKPNDRHEGMTCISEKEVIPAKRISPPNKKT